MGANLHAEATPHHFTLTDEAVLKYGALAKMNPPLRTENDRLAIIEGLKDGTIDLIKNLVFFNLVTFFKIGRYYLTFYHGSNTVCILCFQGT